MGAEKGVRKNMENSPADLKVCEEVLQVQEQQFFLWPVGKSVVMRLSSSPCKTMSEQILMFQIMKDLKAEQMDLPSILLIALTE